MLLYEKPCDLISLFFRCFLIWDYAADANNAKLIIVPLFNGNSNEVILNPSHTQTTVNVSTYAVGQYLVILECDGVIVDYKNIVIN